MPDEYSGQIKATYLKMCSDGTASANLIRPTPKKLRQECVIVYRKKNAIGDKEIVRTFLEIKETDNLEPIIRHADLKKFKTVQNFLKTKTENPRDETIEFIAWLINFKLELYSQGEENQNNGTDTSNEIVKTEPVIIEPSTAIEEKEIKQTGTKLLQSKTEKVEKPKPTISIRILIITCTILLITGSGSFLFWKDRTDRATIAPNEKCMYWTGDHYEAISCDQEVSTPKIPLNIRTLNDLKKINVPDTLTKKDLGKVWYTKINNKPEFFTDSGTHPIDTIRRLKPVTPYILNNYVSYYRYLLMLLVRSICAIICIILIVLLYKYFLKRGAKK